MSPLLSLTFQSNSFFSGVIHCTFIVACLHDSRLLTCTYIRICTRTLVVVQCMCKKGMTRYGKIQEYVVSPTMFYIAWKSHQLCLINTCYLTKPTSYSCSLHQVHTVRASGWKSSGTTSRNTSRGETGDWRAIQRTSCCLPEQARLSE